LGVLFTENYRTFLLLFFPFPLDDLKPPNCPFLPRMILSPSRASEKVTLSYLALSSWSLADLPNFKASSLLFSLNSLLFLRGLLPSFFYFSSQSSTIFLRNDYYGRLSLSFSFPQFEDFFSLVPPLIFSILFPLLFYLSLSLRSASRIFSFPFFPQLPPTLL